jgi:hypothetical protein
VIHGREVVRPSVADAAEAETRAPESAGVRDRTGRMDVMRRALALLLALFLVGSLGSAATATPRYRVTGAMDLQYNLCWPGPQDVQPDWVGTITIEDVAYPMAFFNIGTGKPFAESPGKVVHFEEIWTVYTSLDYAFDEDGCLAEFVPGSVLLSGGDEGVVTLANSTYRMNGSVEVANAPFTDLLGRNVHMSGVIEWYPFGAPQYAPGVWRTS